MTQQLNKWDEQLFLLLNQFHTPWLDPVMFWLTKTEFWLPLYAFLLFLIFRYYKKEGWFILLGIAVTILLADRISSGLIKPYFQRLRPSQEPALRELIHTVNGYRGGLYGFASSHAANTMGVALVIFLVFRKNFPWIGLIFVWAFLMSYTRIYLGVHYPGDVVGGALIGIISGYLGYWFYRWLHSKTTKNDELRMTNDE